MRLSDAGPVNAVPEASQHGTAASLVTGPTPTELVARPRVSPKRQMPTTEPDESGSNVSREDGIGVTEDFNRIAHLAATLTREELLTLDANTILRRLFWEEDVRRFEPLRPRFACSCSRERVAGMLQGLGREEIEGLIDERGTAEVGCDFCGAQYRFDAVDAARLFLSAASQPAAGDATHWRAGRRTARGQVASRLGVIVRHAGRG